MIKKIVFQNFKSLTNATLPLEMFTLLVGPNGCGKSTALYGLDILTQAYANKRVSVKSVRSFGVSKDAKIKISTYHDFEGEAIRSIANFQDISKRADVNAQVVGEISIDRDGATVDSSILSDFSNRLGKAMFFSFVPSNIAKPVALKVHHELGCDGSNLAGVLDQLRDSHPERFEKINEQIGKWLPEFNRIIFETPRDGHRSIALRQAVSGHVVPAHDLSDGTLIALVILTLAFLPDPPPIIAIEEPEIGLHPRLLRDAKDAMYRLAYPKQHGEDRAPVQVIATTHSPTMVDLYRDHPEEIVIASKGVDGVKFERLIDQPRIDEVLADTPLGEAWYSGILGGVDAA